MRADCKTTTNLDKTRHNSGIKLLLLSELPVRAGPYVNGELIYRAIENVIRNAINYSVDGGKVVVRTAAITGGNALRIRIEDSGPGLPESEMDAIFRPFVRAEGTGGPRAGAGLGLAITRQAVELHGGSVRAEKCQPKGLVVEIIIPLKQDWPSAD